MRSFRKETLCSWGMMMLTAGVFVYAAWAMLQKQEPFYSWFYCFAWWSYILFLEGFLWNRRGGSLLPGAPPRGFLFQLPISIAIWLVFEAYNFRMQNWHYMNVPPQMHVRWAGYLIAFATVLPGIFTTARVFEHFGAFKHSGCSAFKKPEWLHRWLIFTGAAFLLLPLLWPRFFFPFVWIGFIFLLEPLNYSLGAASVLRDWEKGSLRKFYLLLLSGAWCGLLWELWNFWSGSKWFYTVPYLGWFKVFEMPLLGFLGFPPFAVECYVMANSILKLREWREKGAGFRKRCAMRALFGIAMALFYFLVFTGIDHFTVVSFM